MGMTTYCWKVAQRKDAQQTRLTACSVSDNDQLPANPSSVSNSLSCVGRGHCGTEPRLVGRRHPLPQLSYLRMTFEEFALAMAGDEDEAAQSRMGEAIDPAVPRGAGGIAV